MLSQRLATGAVGAPLVILTIWVGDALLAAAAAAAVFIAVLEIAAARGPVLRPTALLAAGLAAALPAAALAEGDWFLGAIAAAVLVPTATLAFTREPASGVEVWRERVSSILYFGLLASHFVLLRELENGRDWLIFVLLTVWIADTGAYAVGRTLGRHKLAPAVSPGKTIEGTIGAVVSGALAVVGLNEALDLGLAAEHTVALALILPPAAVIGDLAESAIKRSLDLKDTSGLIPGHGGVADRLDSLLFAAPVVYYYLQWIVF